MKNYFGLISSLLLIGWISAGMSCNSSRSGTPTPTIQMDTIAWTLSGDSPEAYLELSSLSQADQINNIVLEVTNVHNPEVVAFSYILDFPSTETERIWTTLSLFPADQPANFQLPLAPLKDIRQSSTKPVSVRITLRPIHDGALLADLETSGRLVVCQD